MTNRIIDFHTHTFPDRIAGRAITALSSKSHTRAFTDGTVGGLAASMRESGVNVSVIQPVATKPEQVRKINDTAIAINAEAERTGIYSFGGIHPDFAECVEELDRLAEAGIRGIKIHPVYQGVPVDDERYVKILKRAGEAGLTVMIHAGWDIGFPENDFALPERISRALDMAGSVRGILAHMGGWRCWNDALRLFAGREGIYFDSAFSLGRFIPNGDGYYCNDDECRMLSDDEFVEMVKIFGSENVLFGTDSPWASQSETVKTVMSLSLSEWEKGMIFFGNASGILGIV
ncbi:MAG: amidohydrolase [Synergistaceae bacterium]|nr:amidohydrolase [Synergistaceae bacterium]